MFVKTFPASGSVVNAFSGLCMPFLRQCQDFPASASQVLELEVFQARAPHLVMVKAVYIQLRERSTEKVILQLRLNERFLAYL